MSKLQDCADIIKEIMMHNSDDVRLAKNKLNVVFETMLVFLDHQDLIGLQVRNMHEQSEKICTNGCLTIKSIEG